MSDYVNCIALYSSLVEILFKFSGAAHGNNPEVLLHILVRHSYAVIADGDLAVYGVCFYEYFKIISGKAHSFVCERKIAEFIYSV